MGISFHITSVREGTIFNVMQFLSLERVTGVLTIRFGRQLPEVSIYFIAGNIATAEFGAIVGDGVLDMLLCQEFAIKEVSFAPGRINQVNENAIIVRSSNIASVMLNVSKDVDKCESRPFIYGLLPVNSTMGRTSASVLHILQDFGAWQADLETLPKGEKDKKAPLKECVLIHRALSRGVLSYQRPLVSIKSLKALLDLLNPISEKEANNLRGYLRSLLPHPKATHLSIERFYAFASAIESIAQRRSPEVGDRARRAIHSLIQSATKMAEAEETARA
ncbi:MAG: DUF4388 domain-containing protein [Cyanobacteria bacterium SZAS LIN-2]|nr:DUF4388 domain-containing protein [Cyanobacteria bacterium SZAS LIN-2]MBS2009547.1 DUF4388 domain-containing protein [Cyanobacteria bacterium SZAS TMP-1]